MFKKMARDYSTCPTSEKKGDLGEFHEREMDPVFSKQVWSQELEQCDCFIKQNLDITLFGFTEEMNNQNLGRLLTVKGIEALVIICNLVSTIILALSTNVSKLFKVSNRYFF